MKQTWCFLTVAGLVAFQLGGLGAKAGNQADAQPPAVQASISVTLVSASEDHAGTWGVFRPGPGSDNGNGIAITNDWHWQLTLHLDEEKSIKLIEVYENGANQIWTTQERLHWPLVVFYCQQQLNTNYGDVLGPFSARTFDLELYGQVDNRTMHGTHLRLELTDGTSLTAEIPRCVVRVNKHSQPVLDATAEQPSGRPH
jgi:hypothetical protein